MIVGILIGVTIGIMICTNHASAANGIVCLPRPAAVVQLYNNYGEQVKEAGVTDHGNAVAELFVSKSGSWTFLLTRADGMSCIISSGKDWHKPLSVPGGDDS